jgi:PKD repeat protein
MAAIGDAAIGPSTTMVQRANAIRFMSLSLALAGAFMLLAALAVTTRAEYGGLGGLAVFTPGRNGGHLEVNPRAHHAFGVAPDGSSYVAESIEIAGKPYFRIQKLDSKGKYIAETQVKLSSQAHQLEGVAVDAGKQRIYLLVVGERNGEVEQPVFDPEAPVAAELYAFSTEAVAGALEPATGTTAGLLAGEQALDSLSEAAGVPLLHPHGIAVDPTTHDVLILGQQDVSTKKGLGEEALRAAAQRVHTEGASAGKLGPRYVDAENCLDEGATIAAEPACADGFGQSSSPFVSPGGRLYGERSRELWEIPAAEGASESYAPGSSPKVYEVKPKRLFTMGLEEGIEGQEGIVELVSEEEGEGGALAFTPTDPGEGRIYLDAEITAEEGEGNRSQNRGAVVLDYSESGGTPKANELGWTAGQNATGENTKCILPLGSEQVLVGADSSGRLLLFDVTAAVLAEHKSATINVLQFGEGGEGCGHAQATPPEVAVSGETVTKIRLAEKATLSLNVFEADTQHVEWRFKNDGKEEADEQPVVENYPFPTQVPTFEHEFKHAGNYEITAVIEPDNFAPAIEEHSNVAVEGVVISAEFSYTSATTVGNPAKFTAKVTDPYKASPHAKYKYVWEFGDGAKTEGSGTREFKAEHAYAGAGRYTVKLTVTDEGGRAAEEAHTVQVSSPSIQVNTSSSVAGNGSNGGGSGNSGGGTVAVTDTHAHSATLVGTSLIVSKSGEVMLKLKCPAGETDCSGTVMLRTLGAVGVSAKAHVRKSVLTLAVGSFTVVGGQMKAVALHLSARARALLAHSRMLRVRVALRAHDRAGVTYTTQTVVTLRLATPPHRRKR